MAVPAPFLVLRYRNGTNPQVGRIVGGTTFTQVGNDITVAALEAHSTNYSQASGRVIQFQNELYCLISGKLLKFDEGVTDNWLVVKDFTLEADIAHVTAFSGMYHLDISGTPHIGGLYLDTAGDVIRWKFDGTTYNVLELLNTNLNLNFEKGRSVVWRNQIWWPGNWGSSGHWFAWDAVQDTLTNLQTPPYLISDTTVAGKHSCLVVQDNRLFSVCYSSDLIDSQLAIYEYTSGWVLRAAIPSILLAVAAGDFVTSLTAFVDSNNDIIVIAQGRSSTGGVGGTVAAKLTPSGLGFTVTDDTFSQTLIPSGLLPTTLGGAGNTNEGMWSHIVDNVSDPANLKHYLWFLDNDTVGTFSMYEYVNSSTVLTLIAGGGPAFGISVLAAPSGDPSRFWTSGDNSVELVSWEPSIGGETVNFRVRGTGTGLTVKFFRDIGEETPATQVSLAGTLSVAGGASSASRSGNTVINIDADDGSRLYSVPRDAGLDAVTTGDKEAWFATVE